MPASSACSRLDERRLDGLHIDGVPWEPSVCSPGPSWSYRNSRPTTLTKPTLRLVTKGPDSSTSVPSSEEGGARRVPGISPIRVGTTRTERGDAGASDAETLGKPRTHAVGVIVNNVNDPFFDTLLASLEDTLARTGRTVLLCNTNESCERQAHFISKMVEYKADGIIVSPAIGSTAEHFFPRSSPLLPLVFVSRTLSDSAFDYVKNDDYEAGRLATGHLLRLGHRRIAFVGGDPSVSCFGERLRGHRAALRQASVPFDHSLARTSTPDLREGFRAARWISRSTPRPTAANCCNASIALGLCHGLPREGLFPGRNFALVGHEDVAEASLTNPPMSVTKVSRGEMGRRAAMALVERIENPDGSPQRIVLETELIVRGTCGVG